MPSFLSKKSQTKLKVLGWYQIIGGILGILVTIWIAARTGQINGFLLLIILFAIGLYGFSIYAGRLLLTESYRLGLKLSMINQVIQIPQLAMFGYAFWYASGAMFTLGINTTDGFAFTWHFAIMSTYQFSIGTHETGVIIAINFLAIYALYFIEKLQSEIRVEKAVYENEQFMGSVPAILDNQSNLPSGSV